MVEISTVVFSSADVASRKTSTAYGGDCTVETSFKRYGMLDPARARVVEIIHEADLDDERFDAPKHQSWT